MVPSSTIRSPFVLADGMLMARLLCWMLRQTMGENPLPLGR